MNGIEAYKAKLGRAIELLERARDGASIQQTLGADAWLILRPSLGGADIGCFLLVCNLCGDIDYTLYLNGAIAQAWDRCATSAGLQASDVWRRARFPSREKALASLHIKQGWIDLLIKELRDA